MASNLSHLKPIANILVVDDEKDILHVISEGLQRNGFKVSGFTDPRQAMNMLRQHPEEYCAVLSDIRMPGITGFQVAREVKGINPRLKVILMSAFDISPAEFKNVMPTTQVDDFIVKPARVVELKRILLKHIGENKQLLGSTDN